MIPSLTNIGIIVLGAMRVDSGDLTIGELSGFIYMFTLLVFPLRLIGYALSELPHSSAGYRRVQGTIDEPLDADPELSIGPRDGAGGGRARRRVVHGSPTPPSRRSSTPASRIPAGSVTAFVGSTGSGKTTLVELIAGLVAPDRGHAWR